MDSQGKKEVAEAVLIAALSAAACSLVHWGMDSVKDWHATRHRKSKRKAKTKCDRNKGAA